VGQRADRGRDGAGGAVDVLGDRAGRVAHRGGDLGPAEAGQRGLVAVTTPWAWRASWPVLRWAWLAALIAGIALVLYLIYTELITLDAICLLCTSVHVITLPLFALVVYVTTGSSPAGGLSRRTRTESAR
jgi:Vitamin K epoxide reductase family